MPRVMGKDLRLKEEPTKFRVGYKAVHSHEEKLFPKPREESQEYPLNPVSRAVVLCRGQGVLRLSLWVSICRWT